MSAQRSCARSLQAPGRMMCGRASPPDLPPITSLGVSGFASDTAEPPAVADAGYPPDPQTTRSAAFSHRLGDRLPNQSGLLELRRGWSGEEIEQRREGGRFQSPRAMSGLMTGNPNVRARMLLRN